MATHSVTPAAPPSAGAPPGGGRRTGEPHARAWSGTGLGFVVKLVLMALVNAVGVAVAWAAWDVGSWGVLAGTVLLTVVANWVYFSRRRLAGKYVLPGLAFLLVFQLFTMAYTVYVATTNYGTGHNSTREQAVDALLIQSERAVDDAPTYPLTIVERDGEVGFAVVEGGRVLVGTADEPLTPVPDAATDGERVTSLPGWEVVGRARLLGDPQLQEDVLALRVPVSEDADDGSIRTREGTRATVYRSSLEWDPDAGTMTDVESGVVYAPSEDGRFVAPDGTALPVGWIVGVGFENFVRAFTDTNYAGPFWRITGWTFAFAFLTVATSFLLGLAMALVFNDVRVRGRSVLRTLFILPYAFPAFLSALLWRGMLNPNPDYGIVNNLFFFGARIEWLTDPWLAKAAILGVNLWLSFPYWFLVCTGALQSLPGDLTEAARIDGAGRWRAFRSITLPLLLVSTTPLLIASFAFNFNNFVIIYMLTNGGPRFTDTSAPLGHTDILITMIYQISGVAGGRADYGLASALSILVFLVVGGISALAFRRTRKLEEVL
ncbi:ABC transporter permease subunit [Isoptericola variabilis]|uniref:Maltose/maltodextrin transport system permease protein n=1 Tax=Isoptericola variabilis (strain 225) TaxID=743718 RepID=F6FTM1_ISOV2|nr:ABC transporter permease subunit [Isoptericola variabilis]AEG43214.1 ABC-type transporter, integral membrane subunit [Isoptericola variabilis 225]TWH35149.1 arabinogalactan oligomer/maltooligosaccharide transport system permease protein [Isoptericola variabilis J7]